jgi:hypothetical protein
LIADRCVGARVALDVGGGLIMRIGWWICALLVVVAWPVAGGDRMTMKVSPAQAFAPSVLRVRVRIEPDVDNRSLTVTADSGGFFRSSEIPLEGDRAPKTIELEFPSLPEGEYDVVGIVKDSAGHQRSFARNYARFIPLAGSH